jgi:predicted DNA-binding mobile mystery protein A
MQTIGDQIRTIREALGMTQVQLAERSGLAQSMIAGIETGERSNPNFATVNKLAEALNCSFISQLSPNQDIPIFLEEQSDRLARKIVAISSGSSAIELQSPSPKAVEQQILEIKKDLLGKHKSSLWQKI